MPTFHDRDNKNAASLFDGIQRLQISNCLFENDKSKSSSLIYYYNVNNRMIVEVIDCNFIGKMSNNAKYIDGMILNKNSPKIKITDCSFENKIKQAFNLNIIEKVDFENNNIKINIKEVFIAVTLGVALLIIAAIFSITNFIKYKFESDGENI